jgi:hypothetical protein
MGTEVRIGQEVWTAYKKLKSYIYYEKNDLPLRERLAIFECSPDFLENLKNVEMVAASKAPEEERKFQSWIRGIGFRIVPKKVGLADEGPRLNGKFITNVTSSKTTDIETVNYFFDGPLPLHLLAVLWIMRQGYLLDAELIPQCCGSRISKNLLRDDDTSLKLFKKYHEQYSKWRDEGIGKAKSILTDDRAGVSILGLDLQEYFYRVNVDFRLIETAFPSAKNVPALLSCVEAIGLRYHSVIKKYFRLSHKGVGDDLVGLPIGLASSPVLANWHLRDFDREILRVVRPAYYGRYVDDILIVVPTSEDPSRNKSDPVAAFVESLLVKTSLIRKVDGEAYELTIQPGLRLQQSKCILQFFDPKHSIAGLEKFQKKLEQNGSDFMLLPVDEADESLENVAYELLYEGSTNKFRSVKGVTENRYELAKHLARQTILHLLTDELPDRNVSAGLQKFFKGRTAIEFHDLWERVVTLLGVAQDKRTLTSFVKQLQTEIGKVSAPDPSIAGLLRNGLETHLNLSIAMADALCRPDVNWSSLGFDISKNVFRSANMLRHHFVREPLLNFTNYDGPLHQVKPPGKCKLSKKKMNLSPRFVNFDECMLLAYCGNVKIGDISPLEFATSMYKDFNGFEPTGVTWRLRENGGKKGAKP